MHRDFLKVLWILDGEKSSVIATLQYFKCYEIYKGLWDRSMRFKAGLDDNKEYKERDYRSFTPPPKRRNTVQCDYN